MRQPQWGGAATPQQQARASAGTVTGPSPGTLELEAAGVRMLTILMKRARYHPWLDAMLGIGLKSISEAVDQFDLLHNRHPSEGSCAFADRLYRWDLDQAGQVNGEPNLPQDVQEFFHIWRAVERTLCDNYALDQKRRDDELLSQAAPPVAPSKSGGKRKRARDEESGSAHSEDSSSGERSRRSNADKKKRKSETKVKELYALYATLNGGFELDHKTMPLCHSVLAVNDSLKRSPPCFPAVSKEFAILYDVEGMPAKDNQGGFLATDSKMFIFDRFALELTVYALALSVILNAEKPPIKGFVGDELRDKTGLILGPAGTPVLVGALPQVQAQFALRVRTILAGDAVSSFQAHDLCMRLLGGLRDHICENKCSLNVAIFAVQSQVNAFSLASSSGGVRSNYREQTRTRDRHKARTIDLEECRNFQRGSCSRSAADCKYAHTGAGGSGHKQRSASRDRGRGKSPSRSDGGSQSRSEGGSRRDVGSTPGGILRKKTSFAP